MKVTILTISIMLATAINFPAHAQLGGVLRRAADAAQKTEGQTDIRQSVQDAVPEDAAAAVATANRKTQPIWLLERDDYNVDPRGTFAMEIRHYTTDSLKTIKDHVEARHAENLTIMDDIAKEEIKNYEGLMQQCQWAVTTFADIKVEEGKIVASVIDCGLHVAGYNENTKGQIAFLVAGRPNEPAIVDPLPEDEYQEEMARYNNLALMLRQEPPKEQYPELQTAQLARSLIVQAQKNSFALQVKMPMPEDGMNNPALAAEMLKLAQTKFPNMGIVKIIIRDSDWTIERDALGQPLRKRIGTFVIKKEGDNYRMTDHSFAQPYEGGSYGSTIHYAVGLQNFAVDYK